MLSRLRILFTQNCVAIRGNKEAEDKWSRCMLGLFKLECEESWMSTLCLKFYYVHKQDSKKRSLAQRACQRDLMTLPGSFSKQCSIAVLIEQKTEDDVWFALVEWSLATIPFSDCDSKFFASQACDFIVQCANNVREPFHLCSWPLARRQEHFPGKLMAKEMLSEHAVETLHNALYLGLGEFQCTCDKWQVLWFSISLVTIPMNSQPGSTCSTWGQVKVLHL